MEKVASIRKYLGNRGKLTHWLSELPKRPHPKETKFLLENIRRNDLILWTEKGGLVILN